ncbi:MAG: LysM peptidoglycan-binding domain-containing protein [Bacteroidetes bacterium]|nr:LysM peptidoglycan-binding domain-containing protein [Bacteroidota bacterium]
MKTIKVKSGQSTEDIALQEYGAIEGVIYLLMDNNLSPSDSLYPGQELQIRDEVPELTESNRKIQSYLSSRGVSPNSGSAGVKTKVAYVTDGYVLDGYVKEE